MHTRQSRLRASRHLVTTEARVVQVEKAFLAVAITVMLAINVAQAVGRKMGWGTVGEWTDLMMALLPWVGMIGAAVAAQSDRHIGFESLRNAVTPRIRRALFVTSFTATILLFVLLAVSGSSVVMEQYEVGSTSSQMGIPRWMPTAAVPVGGVLMTYHALMSFARQKRLLDESEGISVAGVNSLEGKLP